MPTGGKFEGEEDTGLKMHHNTRVEECISSLGEDISSVVVPGGHSEEALLLLSNAVGDQMCPVANLDQKSMRRDKQATR